MAESKRQKIVDVIRARFQNIRTTNGYETNLGSNVLVWRTQPIVAAQLPALTIRDHTEEAEPFVSGRQDHHHRLFIEVEFATGPATTSKITADDEARKCLADIIKAIGVNIKWPDADGDLAFNTLPDQNGRAGTNQIVVEQEGNTVAKGVYRFIVEYRTQRWNAYS